MMHRSGDNRFPSKTRLNEASRVRVPAPKVTKEELYARKFFAKYPSADEVRWNLGETEYTTFIAIDTLGYPRSCVNATIKDRTLTVYVREPAGSVTLHREDFVLDRKEVVFELLSHVEVENVSRSDGALYIEISDAAPKELNLGIDYG